MSHVQTDPLPGDPVHVRTAGLRFVTNPGQDALRVEPPEQRPRVLSPPLLNNRPGEGAMDGDEGQDGELFAREVDVLLNVSDTADGVHDILRVAEGNLDPVLGDRAAELPEAGCGR